MEEKDNKTVTIPLSEYNRMVEEIKNFKTPCKYIKGKIKKYSGMSIEELEDNYRNHGINIKEMLESKEEYNKQIVYSLKTCVESNKKQSSEIERLNQEIFNLKKKKEELNQDLKLLRKEYDIYYNRCVELKEEINKLNQKKHRWKFWK